MEYLCIEDYDSGIGIRVKNILISSDMSLINHALEFDKGYFTNFHVSEIIETETKFRNNLAKKLKESGYNVISSDYKYAGEQNTRQNIFQIKIIVKGK